MSKMKQMLGMLLMYDAIMNPVITTSDNLISIDKIDLTKKEPIIPKGCKEYMFNKHGGFSTEKMMRDEVVFKCIALNDKSAKKKFSEWESNL